MDEDSLLVKILAGELHYAKLWLVCVALRGVSWDKMPFEQLELAFLAKDAASNCLSIFLCSQDDRAALRYVVHDSLVTAGNGHGLNLHPSAPKPRLSAGQIVSLAQQSCGHTLSLKCYRLARSGGVLYSACQGVLPPSTRVDVRFISQVPSQPRCG